MHFEQVVSGGTLVLPSGLIEADIGIRAGRIVAIGQHLQGKTTIRADRLLVLPGLIDPHVHPIHAENYQTVSSAAIHGGVTTLLHHLYTPPDADPLEYFNHAVTLAEKESLSDFGFHIRLNDLQRTQHSIATLVQQGNPSFKLFMAYGSRGIMVRDDEILLAFQAAQKAGGILLFHAENGDAADLLEAQMQARGQLTLIDYYNSRPKWLELEAVERLIKLLRVQPCPTYLVHLTCQESIAAVSQAKLSGLPVYAETCPHYLLLTAEEAAHLGAQAKMSPPLRTAVDRSGLWTALDKGFINTIGSDHSAFDPTEKEVGENVFAAGFGVPGIATMLPLLYDYGVRGGKTSLEQLIAAMSVNPAKIFGLSGKKGQLAVGYDADFILFDPEAGFVIDATSEGGQAYYSLHEGYRGKGQVQATYQRGQALMLEGEILAKPGRGHFQKRDLTPSASSLPSR